MSKLSELCEKCKDHPNLFFNYFKLVFLPIIAAFILNDLLYRFLIDKHFLAKHLVPALIIIIFVYYVFLRNFYKRPVWFVFFFISFIYSVYSFIPLPWIYSYYKIFQPPFYNFYYLILFILPLPIGFITYLSNNIKATKVPTESALDILLEYLDDRESLNQSNAINSEEDYVNFIDLGNYLNETQSTKVTSLNQLYSFSNYNESIKIEVLQHVTSIYNLINNKSESPLKEEISSQTRNSFITGITGGWGTGKSSYMQAIKSIIEGQTNSPALNFLACTDPIIIDFDLWQYDSKSDLLKSDLLIRNFLDQIEDKLISEIPTINKNLQRYIAQISSLHPWISYFNSFLINDNINQNLRDINNKIFENNRQIFIFIDNIDRLLDKEDIRNILGLIRNRLDFVNTYIFVAYDKLLINSSIENSLNANSNMDNQASIYLEKIFDKEIQVKFSSESLVIKVIERAIKLISYESTYFSLKNRLEVLENVKQLFENNSRMKEKKLITAFSLLSKYINSYRILEKICFDFLDISLKEKNIYFPVEILLHCFCKNLKDRIDDLELIDEFNTVLCPNYKEIKSTNLEIVNRMNFYYRDPAKIAILNTTSLKDIKIYNVTGEKKILYNFFKFFSDKYKTYTTENIVKDITKPEHVPASYNNWELEVGSNLLAKLDVILNYTYSNYNEPEKKQLYDMLLIGFLEYDLGNELLQSWNQNASTFNISQIYFHTLDQFIFNSNFGFNQYTTLLNTSDESLNNPPEDRSVMYNILQKQFNRLLSKTLLCIQQTLSGEYLDNLKSDIDELLNRRIITDEDFRTTTNIKDFKDELTKFKTRFTLDPDIKQWTLLNGVVMSDEPDIHSAPHQIGNRLNEFESTSFTSLNNAFRCKRPMHDVFDTQKVDRFIERIEELISNQNSDQFHETVCEIKSHLQALQKKASQLETSQPNEYVVNQGYNQVKYYLKAYAEYFGILYEKERFADQGNSSGWYIRNNYYNLKDLAVLFIANFRILLTAIYTYDKVSKNLGFKIHYIDLEFLKKPLKGVLDDNRYKFHSQEKHDGLESLLSDSDSNFDDLVNQKINQIFEYLPIQTNLQDDLKHENVMPL
jgi:hypothetical protein